MARADASFSLRLLGPGMADRSDLDAALAIYIRNTSPLLRTKTNQIRAKIRRPSSPEGRYYFAALYRAELVIGFTMYAYYPGSKTLVIDHLVIDRGHRGGAAFQICAQLLYDAIQGMGIEVDFTVAEIEKGKGFGGDQTGGERLARLLGQVEFGEVHVPYFLPNMEAKNYEGRYEGILMMRGPERLYQIRREDLLAICHSVFFEHYLSWYRDFFTSEQIAAYEGHLELLLKELRESLSDKPIVKINGADPGGLIAWHNVDVPRSPEAKAAWYAVIFVMLIGTLGVVAKVAQIPAYFLIPAIIALVMAFLVVVIAGSDRGLDVFERILTNYFGDRQRSRYRRTLSPPVSSKGRNPKAPFARRNSDDE